MAQTSRGPAQQAPAQQPPPPPGARMCHLWFRTLPDVARFISDQRTAEEAEASWRAYVADPAAHAGDMLDLDSYPDGSGRRMRLMARCADLVAFAVDRLTVMGAMGVPPDAAL